MTSRIRDLTRTYDWYIYHGGCSSYDVIAPWPDLTWSICFYQKLRKVCPIRHTKTRRRYAPSFFRYLRKTLGGLHPPYPGEGYASGNSNFQKSKIVLPDLQHRDGMQFFPVLKPVLKIYAWYGGTKLRCIRASLRRISFPWSFLWLGPKYITSSYVCLPSSPTIDYKSHPNQPPPSHSA